MEMNASRASQLLAAALALALPGCATVITGVSFGPLSQRPDPVCDSLNPAQQQRCTPEVRALLQFAERGKAIDVFPEGQGQCDSATLDFGDGTPPRSFNYVILDRAHTLKFAHTYAGWPGKKTVRLRGVAPCTGEASRDVAVGIGADGRETLRADFILPKPTACNPVMDRTTGGQMPRIRKGTGVRIETDGGRINYGAPNQVYDASGDATLPTPAGYPFPDRRKFSLVYRLGSQHVQGEAGAVAFVADETAFLEVCTNDNPAFLADNRGGLLLLITVNERSAIGP